MSTPCCSASFRASGDALTCDAPDGAALIDGAADAAFIGDTTTGPEPPGAGTTGAPASPAAKICAIARPTGMTSPSCAVISRNTPAAGASTSTVTLSVSISTIGSPLLTASAGRLSQRRTLPVSWASSRAGMMTFVGISAPRVASWPWGHGRLWLLDRAGGQRPTRPLHPRPAQRGEFVPAVVREVVHPLIELRIRRMIRDRLRLAFAHGSGLL